MQVFADADCTQYADGSNTDVFVRVNEPVYNLRVWGLNADWWTWAQVAPADPLTGDAATINIWVDWSWEGSVSDTTVEPGIYRATCLSVPPGPHPPVVTIFR